VSARFYKKSNDVNVGEILELAELQDTHAVGSNLKLNYKENVEREVKEIKDCIE